MVMDWNLVIILHLVIIDDKSTNRQGGQMKKRKELVADPVLSRKRNTLKHHFQLAIIRGAIITILILIILTIWNIHASFVSQGEFVADMLARITADRIDTELPEQPTPEEVNEQMDILIHLPISYERVPGLPTFIKKTSAAVTVEKLAMFQIWQNNSLLFESTDWTMSGNDSWIEQITLYLYRKQFDQEAELVFGSEPMTVYVRLQPFFWMKQFMLLVFSLFVVGALSLLFIIPFSRQFATIFSKPFSKTAHQLELLAEKKYNETIQTKLEVKRPLREIHDIVTHTNQLLQKLKNKNDEQELHLQQTELLNEALSIQNEEIRQSKDEIEHAQVKLIQNQNLASIGQLTSSISQDIEGPLLNLKTNIENQKNWLTQLVQDENPSDEEKIYIQELFSALALNEMAWKRMNQLLKGLSSFSQPALAVSVPSDINECLQSVVLLTSNLWKRRIQMLEEYEDIPLFPFRTSSVSQVAMNLVVNAIQAIEKEGRIQIRSWREENKVLFSVEDNGSGIPEENLSKIFESGFTTKEIGKGSGLGLAICADIIRQHSGSIRVKSRLGSGSTFTVSLPYKPSGT